MSEPLDLDAIEARANAATEGPWEAYAVPQTRGEAQYCAVGVGDTEIKIVQLEGGWFIAEFVAASRTDVPALVARVRELTPRVIEGEWESVRDQLDALPDGAQIRWRTGMLYQLELAIRRAHWWEMTGYNRSLTSETIARDEQPIEVIA